MLLRMSQSLSFEPELAFDGQPFTASEADKAGISPLQMDRARRRGVFRTVMRGVYVDSLVGDSLPLRAAAVAKIAPDDAVICRRTAAWLFGIDTFALQEQTELPALDVVRPTGRRGLRLAGTSGHSQTLLAGDVIDWHGLPVTSPAATAVHLARHLDRPFALSALDAMTRAELIGVPELLGAVARYPGHPGIVQAREIARLVDPAAESPGESWLRLRIIDAGFPPPIPQVVVRDEVREYRIDLGFLEPLPETGRRLGLEYDSDKWHSTRQQQAADERRRRDLERMNWDVLSIGRGQVWGRKPALELVVGDLLCMEPRLPRRW